MIVLRLPDLVVQVTIQLAGDHPTSVFSFKKFASDTEPNSVRIHGWVSTYGHTLGLVLL
jgi:hypothetical protein